MTIEITDEEIREMLLSGITKERFWDFRLEGLFIECFNKDEQFRKDCLEIMKDKLRNTELKSIIKQMVKEAITEKFNEDWD